MTVTEYIKNINQRYKLGNSTEHTFRGDLQQLIESIVDDIQATNEPKRQSCGAPDYILTRKEIPIGFIEAKDIGDKDLEGKNKSGNKEQFDRYKTSLDNLIFTDYIEFHLYNDGVFVSKVAIGEIGVDGINPLPNNFKNFENLIKDFCTHVGQNIKSSKKLAAMMAGKARLLCDVIEKSLTSDEDNQEDSTLKEQMIAFRSILIHDITPKGFADVYAQTIAYGLFAARLHDPTLDTFSRQEAAELIPKSNPFLRKLFGYIAGPDIDDRIKWIVDNLIEIFLACNVEQILKNYGKTTKREDPIIHFYEDFLTEYDSDLRKKRGVWYTPAPIVRFIVRAVDDILKSDFNLEQGLADTATTKIKVKTNIVNKSFKSGYKEIEKEVHQVQILDPATGTGTFLAEVIKIIHSKFQNQAGIWSGYVEKHLKPRLNGFELLMASYAMAHLQLDLLLSNTGYQRKTNQRTRVYLTNSLEESHPDTGTLFANWLSSEANEANYIKSGTPIMCVIGNPPYNSSSANQGKWIESLTEVYKENLNERNYNSLSDDYVKFIRYAQYCVDKNETGIVAMITNNSFIDGITQKQMRASLLNSFDKIYIYDLHGSAKRKEKAEDGTRDDNVFKIQQGVSINIFIKNKKISKKEKGVYHAGVLGNKEMKFSKLEKLNLSTIPWTKLNPKEPNYFFIPTDNTGQESYNNGFDINNLFIKKGNGIKFRKDNLLVKYHFTANDVEEMISDINSLPPTEVYKKYNFNETNDWTLEEKKALFNEDDKDSIIPIDYRQFDKRFTYYPISQIHKIIVRGDSRRNLMQNYIYGNNIGLIIGRQGQVVGDMPWNLAFISNKPTDMNIFYRGGGINFPLYIYTQDSNQKTFTKLPNLNSEVIEQISKNVQMSFVNEEKKKKDNFTPLEVIDYIYAVLYSPSYRSKYSEFLKTDFPKIPLPKNKITFVKLIKLGSELRLLHLFETKKLENYITSYPIDGSNEITNKIGVNDWEITDNKNDLGRIWINKDQYFDNIPKSTWEFYIGGYQPAQKWLKDRKERTLDYQEIIHYQKIIVSLSETNKLMKEIATIELE